MATPEPQAARLKCVLLPGLDGGGRFFDRLLAELPATVEPIILTLPDDRVRDYPELALHVEARLPETDDYILVAESFSGPIAILLASRRPAHLKGLVLVATFARSPFPGLSGVATALLPALPNRLPRWLIRSMLLDGDSEDLADDVRKSVLNLDRRALLGRVRTALQCDVSAHLSGLSLPTLVVRAAQDRLLPRSCADQIVARSICAEIIEIAAPHFVLQSKPRAFVERALRPLLKDLLA